jgi:starch synthase
MTPDPALRVLAVAAECFPLVKVGGLADVVGALPRALGALGVEVRVLLPGLEGVLRGGQGWEALRTWPNFMGGGEARLLRGAGPGGLCLYALETPYFTGLAHPYADRPTLAHGFAALSRVAALVAREGDGAGWRPNLLHLHDWPAGLAPAYLTHTPGLPVPSVMTLHNLAYRGDFPPELLRELELPSEAYALDGVEFHGRLSFLKAGLFYATRLTTVSPTYAREIQQPGGGGGLEGLLAWRGAHLQGILNGVDTEVWDPARDPHLTAPFSDATLPRRSANTVALRAELGLDAESGAPLLGVVSRLDGLKGLDLLLDALNGWLGQGGQLALLGSGEPALESAFGAAAAAHPGRVAVRLGFNEGLAHRFFAGADLLAIPSRAEPCGLTQMYAQRYGALPVARRTGGLADTVVDLEAGASATGFLFEEPTAAALGAALGRARALFDDREGWQRLQRQALAQDFGWAASARSYRDLFQSLCLEVP